MFVGFKYPFRIRHDGQYFREEGIHLLYATLWLIDIVSVDILKFLQWHILTLIDQFVFNDSEFLSGILLLIGNGLEDLSEICLLHWHHRSLLLLQHTLQLVVIGDLSRLIDYSTITRLQRNDNVVFEVLINWSALAKWVLLLQEYLFWFSINHHWLLCDG